MVVMNRATIQTCREPALQGLLSTALEDLQAGQQCQAAREQRDHDDAISQFGTGEPCHGEECCEETHGHHHTPRIEAVVIEAPDAQPYAVE